ncbi:MAG TPA: EpsI family protein [Pyrinomonadaceae bacterium]|nr:EpsI family protein [Pyrinomonadaceae bacterium]
MPTQNRGGLVTVMIVAAAIAFLYAPVLAKLGYDWWSDENYSHGLLVPFVIAFILWQEKDLLSSRVTKPNAVLAWSGIAVTLTLLMLGTLGSELFTQRMSLVVMLASVTVYFLGRRLLGLMAVPFALLLLAIPIPQIVFNRIAMPLQMWASQIAVWGIRLFEVPTLRKGNVIDILPNGGIQSISLEVVEACSGIRSLMTLVTLGLILAYFTRQKDAGGFANLTRPDLVRAGLLMLAAIPIAVLTNAARVAATGVMTYEYGKQATEAAVHDISGWVVYVVALLLLIGVNLGLKRCLPDGEVLTSDPADHDLGGRSVGRAVPLVMVLAVAGCATNWLANRTEDSPPREQLTSLSSTIGDWRQRGIDIRFSKESEEVLRATDYTMREYAAADGRIANLYVGYYATQRSGATYHSPQNCLPGAGWILTDPQVVTITSPSGRTFQANRYVIENGVYREVMLYWYQGRGRVEASEYRDKLNTVLDSVTRRRSDGAMVRVMTSLGDDAPAAFAAASGLAGELEDQLPAFIPD